MARSHSQMRAAQQQGGAHPHAPAHTVHGEHAPPQQHHAGSPGVHNRHTDELRAPPVTGLPPPGAQRYPC